MKKTRLMNLGLWFAFAATIISAQQATPQLPSDPLKFGVFVVRFDPGGTFSLQGERWPSLSGTWKITGNDEIELTMTGGPGGCDGPGRYQFGVAGGRVTFNLVSDECVPRRMIVGGSTWSPAGESKTIPVRNITRTEGAHAVPRDPGNSKGSWPSFRG